MMNTTAGAALHVDIVINPSSSCYGCCCSAAHHVDSSSSSSWISYLTGSSSCSTALMRPQQRRAAAASHRLQVWTRGAASMYGRIGVERRPLVVRADERQEKAAGRQPEDQSATAATAARRRRTKNASSPSADPPRVSDKSRSDGKNQSGVDESDYKAAADQQLERSGSGGGGTAGSLNPAVAAAAEKVLETAMAVTNMVQELVSGKTNWAKDDTKHTATTAAVAKEDASSREEEEEEALSSCEDDEKEWGADHEKAKDAVKDITHKLNEEISLPNMNKAKDISSLDGEEEEEEEDKTLSKKDYENFVNPGAPEEAADHAETGPGGGGDQKEKFSREGRFGSTSSVLKAKTEEVAEALKKTVEDAIRGTQKDTHDDPNHGVANMRKASSSKEEEEEEPGL